MMSSVSPNSNYQSWPSNVCTTPTQPLHPPMMAMPPVGSTMLSRRYRDNSTAITYTFQQMTNFMWRQHPTQSRQLASLAGYTDLATGQTFTYDQMMVITRPRLPGQPIQPFQQQFQHQHQHQHQPQQPVQQPVYASSNGQNLQPRTYQQMMPLQQQHIREMQQVQSARIQARMLQQTNMQQMQGQQWAQHSLLQQPNKYPSYQTTNTGQRVVTDRYAHQWTPEQYREIFRRQKQQMAQLSAVVSPMLQQQEQSIPRVSPPMTVSQTPGNNAGRPLAASQRAELLQLQQMNIQSPQAFTRPLFQEQAHPALPVMTSRPQQPVYLAPSAGQLAQKQLPEVVRVGQAQKSVLPPSKSSHGAKVPIPAKPSTQPAAHKQGVRKTRKQPRALPVLVPAPAKIPEATKTVQQTSVAQVKPVANSVTPKPCNPTVVLPIRRSDMLPPPIPSSPRDPLSTRTSTPASPSAVPSQHSPCPPAATSNSSDTIDTADAEFDKVIEEELSRYLSDCRRYASEVVSSQDSVPEGSGSCVSSSSQATTATNTPTTTTSSFATPSTTTTSFTPQATPTTTSTTPQPTPTAATTSPTPGPTTPTMPVLPIFSPRSRSRSPSPSSSHTTFSLFANYQDSSTFAGFSDYSNPDATIMPALQDGDPSRAPEERRLSEERARLEWEIMALGEKYAGGDGEMEGGEEVME